MNYNQSINDAKTLLNHKFIIRKMKSNIIEESPKLTKNDQKRRFDYVDEVEVDSQLLSEFTIEEKAGLGHKFETSKNPNLGSLEFPNSSLRLSSKQTFAENNLKNHFDIENMNSKEVERNKNQQKSDIDSNFNDLYKLPLKLHLSDMNSEKISKEEPGNRKKINITNLRQFLAKLLHPNSEGNYSKREIKKVFNNPSNYKKREIIQNKINKEKNLISSSLDILKLNIDNNYNSQIIRKPGGSKNHLTLYNKFQFSSASKTNSPLVFSIRKRSISKSKNAKCKDEINNLSSSLSDDLDLRNPLKSNISQITTKQILPGDIKKEKRENIKKEIRKENELENCSYSPKVLLIRLI